MFVSNIRVSDCLRRYQLLLVRFECCGSSVGGNVELPSRDSSPGRLGPAASVLGAQERCNFSISGHLIDPEICGSLGSSSQVWIQYHMQG